MRWPTLMLALAVVAPACARSLTGSVGAASSDGGNPGEGNGTDGGSLFPFGDGGGVILGACDGGPSGAGGTLTAAGGPNIVVHGQPLAVQLTAAVGGVPISGIWTTSDTAVGSVSSDGVFHANGYVGGTVD